MGGEKDPEAGTGRYERDILFGYDTLARAFLYLVDIGYFSVGIAMVLLPIYIILLLLSTRPTLAHAAKECLLAAQQICRASKFVPVKRQWTKHCIRNLLTIVCGEKAVGFQCLIGEGRRHLVLVLVDSTRGSTSADLNAPSQATIAKGGA